MDAWFIIAVGLGTGVPMWGAAIYFHVRNQRRMAQLESVLVRLADATEEQTKIIRLAFGARIDTERRTLRRALVEFLENTGCFQSLSDVMRLTKDMPSEIVGRMVLSGTVSASLNSVIDISIYNGNEYTIRTLVENAADILQPFRWSLDFQEFRERHRLIWGGR